MRIRWTLPAADDLENIKDYLQQHYPHLAEPTVRTIYQRIRSLKSMPISAGLATEAALGNSLSLRCRMSLFTP